MFALFLWFCVTVVVLILSWTLQQKWKYRSVDHVPGPKPLPILGNALEFGLSPVEILKDLTRLMNIYGFVYRVTIGPNNCYLVISDPELTEFFLSSPKYITKSTDYDLLRPWIANGLLTSNGSYWQKRRKVITPTFHFKILEDFIPTFNAGGDILIQNLSKKAGNEEFDIYPYITAYTLDVICETAMGTTVKAQENFDNEYVRAVKTICNVIMIRTFSPWKHFDSLFRFSREYEIQKECLNIIHGFTRSVIEKRHQELTNDNCNNTVNKADDDIEVKKKQAFLDLLLHSTIDGKPLSDDDISEEVDTFMFEGHDTTASAICFAIYELSKNPRVQEKLYAELKGIFDNKKNPKVSMHDLNEMRYLELVIKEALRMYPSVPMFGRNLQEDTMHKGVLYPKGLSLVFFCQYMHRRADIFKDPHTFNPDRFLPEFTDNRNPYAYIPFSAGPRNCIGQKFAMYELKSSLSKIVWNFEILPAGTEHDIILSAEVILKSASGVHVRLKQRQI